MLEEQCNTWQGITSVAVYYPLYIFQNTNADRLREAITTVENFHEQIDRSHGERMEQMNCQHMLTFMYIHSGLCSGMCSGLFRAYVRPMNVSWDYCPTQESAGWTSYFSQRSLSRKMPGHTPTMPCAIMPSSDRRQT